MNAVIKLDELIIEYNQKIDDAIDFGIKKAEAEHVYRKALSKYLAEKILQGNKVTVLGDLARGDDKVADLRLERDKWTVLYESTQERIFALRTEIRITETNLKLEYGKRD